MPSRPVLAARLAVSEAELARRLVELDAAHGLLLAADGSIRMLSPFSGVPTPYAVACRGQTYHANCAWDTIGIAAALRADVAATVPLGEPSGAWARVTVRDGRVDPARFVVHFPHPVRRWYDDLVYT
jgi:hypothetical protein